MRSSWVTPTAVLLSIIFTVASVIPGYAQGVFLPEPGKMVELSPAFKPCLMTGVRYSRADPLRYDFVMDPGDLKLSASDLEVESIKLIKYFLASLTTPKNDLWVNLSPYEEGRIIPDKFGLTDMGRDLLRQDYLLKQITASLISPEKALGKAFWDRVYQQAYQRFGTTDVTVNTFHKVWIVPDKADIYVDGQAVFVVNATMKLMMETDYLAEKNAAGDPQGGDDISTGIMRAIILPELEREVNEGRNFAAIRQVYHSLILATWLKQKIQGDAGGFIRGYVDQNKTAGVEHGEKDAARRIFNRYVEAFQKGVYNLIKEDSDPDSGETLPRKYFSGGADYAELGKKIREVPLAQAKRLLGDGPVSIVRAILDPQKKMKGAVKSYPAVKFDLKAKTLSINGFDADYLGEGGNNIIFRFGGKVFRVQKNFGFSSGVYLGFSIGESYGIAPHVYGQGFSQSGHYFLITDYVAGQPLDHIVNDERRPFTHREAALVVDLVRTIFKNGLYIPDFKWSNIVIGRLPGRAQEKAIIVDAELISLGRERGYDLKKLVQVLRGEFDWHLEEDVGGLKQKLIEFCDGYIQTGQFPALSYSPELLVRDADQSMKTEKLKSEKNNDRYRGYLDEVENIVLPLYKKVKALSDLSEPEFLAMPSGKRKDMILDIVYMIINKEGSSPEEAGRTVLSRLTAFFQQRAFQRLAFFQALKNTLTWGYLTRKDGVAIGNEWDIQNIIFGVALLGQPVKDKNDEERESREKNFRNAAVDMVGKFEGYILPFFKGLKAAGQIEYSGMADDETQVMIDPVILTQQGKDHAQSGRQFFQEKSYPGIAFDRTTLELAVTGADGKTYRARSLDGKGNRSNYIRYFEDGPYQGKVFRISITPTVDQRTDDAVLDGFLTATAIGLAPRVDGFTQIEGLFTVVVDHVEGKTLAEITADEFKDPHKKALSHFMDVLIASGKAVMDFGKEGNFMFVPQPGGEVRVVIVDAEDVGEFRDIKGRDLADFYRSFVAADWQGPARDYLMNEYFPEVNIDRIMAPGGIDFNTDMVHLNVQGSAGEDASFRPDPAQFLSSDFQGFLPVIIGIDLVNNGRSLLGGGHGVLPPGGFSPQDIP